jgi:ankyrin repeat protein
VAAHHGHGQTVAALLERGAGPDRPSDRGQPPLAGAVFKGEQKVIDALLDGGADPAAGTPSAVDTARMFGQDALVARFESRGPARPAPAGTPGQEFNRAVEPVAERAFDHCAFQRAIG